MGHLPALFQKGNPGLLQGRLQQFIIAGQAAGMRHGGFRRGFTAAALVHNDRLFFCNPGSQGQKIFTQKTCVACHTRGIGPDLTHVGSRETLAAGVLENTPANMARWLKNPQAVKPGSYMPNFNLTDAEVKALTAFLEASK